MPLGVATGHHNMLGDLVPRLAKVKNNDTLVGLINTLIHMGWAEGTATQLGAGPWRMCGFRLPWEDDYLPTNVAFTCVAQLGPQAVGVVKIMQNGDCTVFVRLKAADMREWAKTHPDSLPSASASAFWCELQHKTGRHLLEDARAMCLKGHEVHHPHALSILCTMSLAGLLKAPVANEWPTQVGTVRLVALPHIDTNLEQCLCLMGWKATFSKDNLNTSLLQKVRVDASVWGKTYDAMTTKETAEKMNRAAEELRKCADPTLFTKLIPTLNKSAPECKRLLDKVRAMLLGAKESEAGPSQSNGHPPPAASGARMAESDDDQSESEDAAPVVPEPKPEPKRTPKRAPKRAPKRKKPDDSDDSDSDNESAVSKEDADLSRVVHTSDEEDSSSSSSSESGSEESDSEASAEAEAPAEAPQEAAKAAPVPVAAANTSAQEQLAVARNREEHVVTLAAAAARETILDTFKEQAAPCCEHMQDWMRKHQLTTSQERMHAINKDVERLKRGDSAAGMMAAALRLVEALSSGHADGQTGDFVPINTEVQQRASAAVYKAKEFTATTLEQVEDMIGQLRTIHQQGCSVQECVSQVGARALPPAHHTA